MLIDFIAGSKIDFYKIAPVIAAVQEQQDAGVDIGYRLIYTGTKVDIEPEDEGFSHYSIPAPNILLDISEPDPAAYAAAALMRYEQVLVSGKPNIVMLFGHSTGVMACSLVAAKTADIKIAHIGSGMRSFNRYSGDEVNRKVIDSVTDYYFPIAQSSGENLRNEGVPDDYIFFVGNPVSDLVNREMADMPQPAIWNALKLQQKRYFLLNLEHSSVTGSQARMKSLLLQVIRLSKGLQIILPVNNDSSKTLKSLGIKAPNLHIIESQGISSLYYLAHHAKAVLTDTEQLQDETTLMQIPCMTLLKSVARPDTYTIGFNEIVGLQPESMTEAFHKLFAGDWKKGRIPYLWDGKVAGRILSVLKKLS
ncbi:MAG: UDP-N-acetylglucosamine 2-epimerase [Chitinophagaceae bacterium]|nr:UDP-N-acetylglucosamine 2-epimerase [Chitinophagaceae bacterium]MCB9046517.1 UDP-N-acetylglucosamine 2-epimerase [Chitinophagales bacterium]